MSGCWVAVTVLIGAVRGPKRQAAQDAQGCPTSLLVHQLDWQRASQPLLAWLAWQMAFQAAAQPALPSAHSAGEAIRPACAAAEATSCANPGGATRSAAGGRHTGSGGEKT